MQPHAEVGQCRKNMRVTVLDQNFIYGLKPPPSGEKFRWKTMKNSIDKTAKPMKNFK
jgi:hypothetical protein